MTTATALGFAKRELGYSKTERTFHLKDANGKHTFESLEGFALFDGADAVGGHLTLFSDLDDSGTLGLAAVSCYLDEVPGDALYADWWQCCFIRRENKFRLWPADNRTPVAKIMYDDIRGPGYVSWHDRGGHIYVHGRIWQREVDGRTVIYVAGDVPPAGLVRK